MNKTPEAEMFDHVEEIEDNSLVQVPVDKQKPLMGDQEWTKWVLDQLNEKELVKGLPKMEGLRRITNRILGRVISSEADILFNANDSNGWTTVAKHTLIIQPPEEHYTMVFTAVADVKAEDLNPPFNKYLSANASTKAMGRAYRDALQLKVCVADELNDVNDLIVVDGMDDEDLQPADSTQIAAIKSMCKRLNIDVEKFINYGPFKHKNLEKILKGTGRAMMSKLNSYQSDQAVPKEILK